MSKWGRLAALAVVLELARAAVESLADQLPKSLEKNPFFWGKGGGGAELGGSGGGEGVVLEEAY
jgi:hypothetical protein